jgi:hypothetical protein
MAAAHVGTGYFSASSHLSVAPKRRSHGLTNRMKLFTRLQPSGRRRVARDRRYGTIQMADFYSSARRIMYDMA